MYFMWIISESKIKRNYHRFTDFVECTFVNAHRRTFTLCYKRLPFFSYLVFAPSTPCSPAISRVVHCSLSLSEHILWFRFLVRRFIICVFLVGVATAKMHVRFVHAVLQQKHTWLLLIATIQCRMWYFAQRSSVYSMHSKGEKCAVC